MHQMLIRSTYAPHWIFTVPFLKISVIWNGPQLYVDCNIFGLLHRSYTVYKIRTLSPTLYSWSNLFWFSLLLFWIASFAQIAVMHSQSNITFCQKMRWVWFIYWWCYPKCVGILVGNFVALATIAWFNMLLDVGPQSFPRESLPNHVHHSHDSRML